MSSFKGREQKRFCRREFKRFEPTGPGRMRLDYGFRSRNGKESRILVARNPAQRKDAPGMARFANGLPRGFAQRYRSPKLLAFPVASGQVAIADLPVAGTGKSAGTCRARKVSPRRRPRRGRHACRSWRGSTFGSRRTASNVPLGCLTHPLSHGSSRRVCTEPASPALPASAIAERQARSGILISFGTLALRSIRETTDGDFTC